MMGVKGCKTDRMIAGERRSGVLLFASWQKNLIVFATFFPGRM